MSDSRFKIAVLGSSSAPEDSRERVKAYSIGFQVASRNGVLLTGACPGLPHAASLGAQSAGGFTIGISPAMRREDHRRMLSYPLNSDVILYTGMGAKGRNVILVRSADACIFIGGSMGTLNEFTIAFDDLDSDCAIGVISGSGGFSDELLHLARKSDRNARAALIVEPDPETLVNALFHHLEMVKSRS